MTPLLVAGDGKVATALLAGLRRAGFAPLAWSRKMKTAPPSCGLAILAVKDEAVSEVAARMPEGALLLHCAAALGAKAPLGSRPGGLFHPLKSFAGGESDFAGVVFTIAGDAAAIHEATQLAERLGGLPVVLDDDAQVSRYHAAAALASNHVLALLDVAAELFEAAGFPRATALQGLAALTRSVSDNLRDLGLPAALTGPIARGDVRSVERHLAALRDSTEALALYRATAARVLSIARQQGRADAAQLKALADLLNR